MHVQGPQCYDDIKLKCQINAGTILESVTSIISIGTVLDSWFVSLFTAC
jgi:hypothetical protein